MDPTRRAARPRARSGGGGVADLGEGQSHPRYPGADRGRGIRSLRCRNGATFLSIFAPTTRSWALARFESLVAHIV